MALCLANFNVLMKKVFNNADSLALLLNNNSNNLPLETTATLW